MAATDREIQQILGKIAWNLVLRTDLPNLRSYSVGQGEKVEERVARLQIWGLVEANPHLGVTSRDGTCRMSTFPEAKVT